MGVLLLFIDSLNAFVFGFVFDLALLYSTFFIYYATLSILYISIILLRTIELVALMYLPLLELNNF